MKNIKIFLLCIVCVIFAGCTKKSLEERLTKLDDPTARYCVQVGGKILPRVKTESNKRLLCRLSPVKVVDAWELYEASRKLNP
ncbi:DUF333 domain-containing protein [Campylobacter suis]|uniref:DUF333 domain-containing protein n=1 Tax=Campylobacter suis TaxID=2790657 RepID=A0ABN7K3X5_9BACT|nr:DUF333 domain-containing protein [Campylobacter suis]CAD7287214.1 hypothetical protein LMG8286_00845 [Campylobacter suis]